jgi:hypothetical protein
MVNGSKHPSLKVAPRTDVSAVSVWTELPELTVVTVRGSGHPRGMTLAARIQKRAFRAGVGSNGILESKLLSKHGPHTVLGLLHELPQTPV